MTSTAIGSRLTSRLTKMLSLVTLMSYFVDLARGLELVELGLQLVDRLGRDRRLDPVGLGALDLDLVLQDRG